MDNDFSTAARAEAHARSMAYVFSAVEPEKPLDWGGGFQEGAVWARDHLAAQEPTDAECIAVLDAVTAPIGEEPMRGEWARGAINRCRRALVAARAVRQEKR